MPTEKVRIGLKGEFMIGTAGAQASTVCKNVENVTFDGSVTWYETTRRGSKAETQTPILGKYTLEFVYQDRENDSNFPSLRDAWLNGTAISIYALNVSGGEGPDGDYFLGLKREEPLKGGVKYTFEAVPTDEYGRDPTWS